MAATATAPKPVRLSESFISPSMRVDRANGIIRRVKLVGLHSKNVGRTIGLPRDEFNGALDQPYSYAKRALEDAKSLYEGASFKFNHPDSELDDNGVRQIKRRKNDAFMGDVAIARNVVIEDDGAYGDMHLFVSHPGANYLMEVAEKAPNKLAISHNASGIPELKNGRALITKILSVHSLDIVADKPGTTNGLFESLAEDQPMPRKLRQVIEALPAKTRGRRELLELASEMIGKAKGGDLNMPPLAPGAEPNPAAEIDAALETIVVAIVRDKSLNGAAKAAKIKEILKMADKVQNKNDGSFESDTELDEGAEGTEGGGDKKKKKAPPFDAEESLALDRPLTVAESRELLEELQELRQHRRNEQKRERAHAILEKYGREPTTIRVEALMALDHDEDKQKRLIETWDRHDEPRLGTRPASTGSRRELDLSEQSKNAEEFASRLLS